MITISDMAEEKLVPLLKDMRIKGSGYAFHINGTALTSEDFERLPELIKIWLGDDTGTLVICEDKDLFLLSSDLDIEKFKKFNAYFYTRLKHRPAHANALSFYDIALNGPGLIELAQTKLNKAHARKNQVKKEVIEKEKQILDIMNVAVSQDQIKALQQRRTRRYEPNILIVDDDPFSRKLVGLSLRNECQISFAEDARMALALYLQQAPDIVFLDIELTDANGLDLLKKILSFDPSAYIVMVSGKSHQENIVHAIKTGAKGFIGKPFSMDLLLQHIRKCSRYPLEPARS